MDNNCFSERDSRNISIPATIINDDKERRYLPANRRGLTNFDHQLSLGPLVVGQDYAKVDAALIATEKYISVTRDTVYCVDAISMRLTQNRTRARVCARREPPL